MKKYLFFVSFVILFIPSAITAQESTHPIDIFLDSCMEKDYTTFGMVNCIEKAIEMWNVELDKYYNLLMTELDGESAKILKSAEVDWIKYKEKEMENIESIYGKLKGTMYTPMKYFAKLEIVKTRALQLADYYDLTKQGYK